MSDSWLASWIRSQSLTTTLWVLVPLSCSGCWSLTETGSLSQFQTGIRCGFPCDSVTQTGSHSGLLLECH